MALVYRTPPGTAAAASGPARSGLPRDELLLTLLAALVWGLFNAGYVVYLSFAPRVLVAGGYSATQAAAVISLASWVMIFSVTAAGRVADRTGRHATVLGCCLAVGVLSLLLLQQVAWAVPLSLAFGLTAAPPLAGWLFDRSGRPFDAIVLAAALFAATALGYAAFAPLKRRLQAR